jgi:hypothetical protein
MRPPFLPFIIYAATPPSVVHLCSMPYGSFLWIFSVFCSRALRSRLTNSMFPHLIPRFFLRSILKELNSGKENVELGKCLFFTFILFLVQLLQSVFVGRYLYITPVLPHYCLAFNAALMQVRCVAQRCSRQERHPDHDLPQDPCPECRGAPKGRRQLRRQHTQAHAIPRQHRVKLLARLPFTDLVRPTANFAVRSPLHTTPTHVTPTKELTTLLHVQICYISQQSA